MKETLISTPVLAFLNFKEQFILETDVSGMGIGVILCQGQHPIAYFSKRLSLRMQRQSTYIYGSYVKSQKL